MSTLDLTHTREKTLLPRLLSAVVLTAVLFLAALAAWIAGFQLYYAGRIYPGVTISGVDLSGLKPDAAAAQLAAAITYPASGKITLQDKDKSWQVSPAELGFFLDPESSALKAFNAGREGGLIDRLSQQSRAWFSGLDQPAVMVLDERISQRYLLQLASQVDSPVVEASLAVQGTDVIVNSGQVGRKLDVDASIQLLTVQLQTLQDGTVPLFIRETTPVIMDANAQAELARQILSQPLTITLPGAGEGDPGPWTFDRDALSQMLTIQRVKTDAGEAYQVAIQAETLRTFLTNLAPQLDRTPANARFIFNDDTHQLEVIQHAVTGRALDIDGSIAAINSKLATAEHSIPLVISTTSPEAPDSISGADLGITELVHSETSYFRGSGAARVQNIKTAASRFHGLLIAPGETFSMAQALGDVSLDAGYEEALIIFGDRTIKGVGGGVCQVSTTLFRAVFFAGYPVVERHAHAYRVSYYEQNANGINVNFAGLDATVFVPVVDFKFTNDTPYWLLMETYVNGASLTWKFYSTSDGRTVDWDTTGVTNVTDPGDPVYRENPDLPEGTLKQIEWPAKGADVSVLRTVMRDGSVYLQDRFNTHYMPWQEVWEYGPGTELPEDSG